MKLYLLKGWDPKHPCYLEEGSVTIYGIFSSNDLANKYRAKLEENMKKYDETVQFYIDKLVL